MGAPRADSPRSRPSPSARRAAGAAAAVVAMLGVSGCAANFNAPTNEPYQPAQGISDREGGVYALNTLVVTDEAGNGTVVSSLLNKQEADDQLESFAAVDSKGDDIAAAPLPQPINLPAQGPSVQVGTTGDLRLSGDNLVAGQFVSLTLTFGSAAPITFRVPVVPVGDLYTDIPVGPAPGAATTSAG